MICVESNSSFHLVWPELMVSKFLRWLGGVNVGCVEVDLVSGFEDWGRSSALIVIPCHIIFRLGEYGLGFL